MTAQAMQFRKDKNDDGSEDSIYLICFRTVGWKNRNADLEVAGRDHIRIQAISYQVFAERDSVASQLNLPSGYDSPCDLRRSPPGTRIYLDQYWLEDFRVKCPKCDKSGIYRVRRQGSVLRWLCSLLGYYPWWCPGCCEVHFVKKRSSRGV
jgi:hypothetical protein